MTVLELFTLQVIVDGSHDPLSLAALEPLMAETEENLTDLLPAGYRARIRRWDHPDPEDDPGEEQDE